MKHVIIYGLRRFGTTILWEALTTSRMLRCYDESFHPSLGAGMRHNHKGTWSEFAEFLSSDPLILPELIQPVGELEPVSTSAQMAWLGSLCTSATPAVIDIVRGWNRAPAIHAKCGEVLSVHLVRGAASWAAAHLLPTGAPTFRRTVAGVYRRLSFFQRRGFYDNYQYQTIIDAALEQDHPVFRHVALSRTELSGAPANIKLLAFFWGANCTLAQRLAAVDAPRLTMTLTDFSRQPSAEVAWIKQAAGWQGSMFSTADVRVEPPAYGENSPRWLEAARRLGLPATLFDPAATTESLRSAVEMGRQI